MLSADQVRKRVNRLENNNGMKAVRTKAKDRLKLVAMQLPSDLPEHMTRGQPSDEPTPILIKMVNSWEANMRAYPIIPAVTAFDTGLEKEADALEMHAALSRARLDDGKRITTKTYKQWALHPYTVWILRCGSPDEDFPWSVEVGGLEICFFPDADFPCRPTEFAMHYKRRRKDIEDTYSGRKNWDPKGGDDHNGGWEASAKKFKYHDGKWDAKYDGLPVAVDAEDANEDEMCEMMEYHVNDEIYHLALNKDGKSGEVVWYGKSMTGGVSAIVLPSVEMPFEQPWLRHGPGFWPEMQMTLLINRTRAKRATRSELLRPDVLLKLSPEELKVLSDAGLLQQVMETDSMATAAGGPNFFKHPGDATIWQIQPDPDLDKQELSYWTEMNSYRNERMITSQPEVIKDSNTNVFLTYAESQHKQETPALDGVSWGWKKIIEFQQHSIKEYKRDFPLFATEEIEYGSGKKAERGTQATIGPNDIDPKKFSVSVSIRSTSEAESRMRVQDAVYNEGIGAGTHDEVVAARGVSDVTRKNKEIMVDAAYRLNAPAVTQQVLIATEERSRLRGNAWLRFTQPPGAVEPEGDSGASPSYRKAELEPAGGVA